MTAIISGEFILLVALLAFNFILCFKQIPKNFPIINMVFGIFTIIISVAVLSISDVPAQPYLSLLTALLGAIQFLIAFLGTKI